MNTYARKTANVLERQRAELLGASAALTFYDATGAELAEFTRCFFVCRESNLTIGEEYQAAEVSERAGMTAEISERVTTAKLSTSSARFDVTVVEAAMTAARTWKFRLTPSTK